MPGNSGISSAVNGFMVSYQHVPASPTERPVAIPLPEFHVGKFPEFFDIDAVQKIRLKLPDRCRLYISVVGAYILAYVAAPYKPGLPDYICLFPGQAALLLGKVGFAARRVYCKVSRDTLAGASPDTF